MYKIGKWLCLRNFKYVSMFDLGYDKLSKGKEFPAG